MLCETRQSFVCSRGQCFLKADMKFMGCFTLAALTETCVLFRVTSTQKRRPARVARACDIVRLHWPNRLGRENFLTAAHKDEFRLFFLTLSKSRFASGLTRIPRRRTDTKRHSKERTFVVISKWQLRIDIFKVGECFPSCKYQKKEGFERSE